MKTKYLYLIAIFVIAFDQISKYLIVNTYTFGFSEPVIHNIFHITPWKNYGGAFGFFQSWAGGLAFVSAIVAVIIVVLIHKNSSLPGISGVALSLQLGGAVGNLIDRVRLQYVVDFIDLQIWPIFNIADAAITVGIIMLAYHFFFCEARKSSVSSAAVESIEKDY
ncbi:MAG: signal peptidase II [Armatimonadota bacterium]